MTRGATLPELVLALLIAGLLALLAMPAFARVRDRLAVERAAHALAGAHTRARLVALTERRAVLLTLAADTLRIHALESPTDTILRWQAAGPTADGIATTGLPRIVTFAPSGVTLGVSNGSCTLTRGGARRQVVMSRYGRVRIL